MPTAKISIAGEELTVNVSIFSASSRVILPLSYSRFVSEAPTGYPEINDKKIGAAVALGNPKISRVNGASGFDNVSLAPDRAMNSASIIKGKSDGITTSPHTEMPLRIPAEMSAPKIKKNPPIMIEKIATKIRLSIKITTKIYAPAYFYSHLLITFGIRNQLAYSG